MVEPALIAIAGCQCLYAKVKGHNALLSHLLLFLLVDKRAVVVSSRISGNSNFLKLFGWWVGQMRHDIGITFWSPIAASTGRKDDRIALDFQVHGRVAQRKELMPRLETGKSWFFRSFGYPLEEGLHRSVKTKVDLNQELVIDCIDLWIVHSPRFECLLGLAPSLPALPIAQRHHPPVM